MGRGPDSDLRAPDQRAYLDYNATTPVDARVVEAMRPFWTDLFANAASEHPAGHRVRLAVDDAREQVATALCGSPSGVTFTSGSTESINLALQGVASATTRQTRFVTFATEHKAVLDTCEWLARRGTDVEVLAVKSDGLPDLDLVADRVRSGTTLVSVMAVNNETGVVNPVREIADIARSVGALVHCDATQALGKMPLSIEDLGADLVSVSSHKAYGPKGVGALLIRRTARPHLEALIHGGGHERGLRSGTLNSPGIVGFGAACGLATAGLANEMARLRNLRERLEVALVDMLPEAEINGRAAPRVANTLNIRLTGLDADATLLAMPHIAASTGSACTASSPAPSHVLRAMGLSYEAAQECVRFSLGRFSTHDDIEAVVASLNTILGVASSIGLQT